MRIGIISTHSFSITRDGTITKTGDVVIVDLIRSLEELNHEIIFIAPEGSYVPSKGQLLPMRASYGKFPPSSQECELEAFNNYFEILKTCDIVHDFSVSKCITESLYQNGFKNVIQTIMGGPWTFSNYPPRNLIVWSKSHKDRVLRGATDYENCPNPGLAGPPQQSVKDVHIVNGGIDTEFYHPTYEKKNYYLWLNRFHETKGYAQAIQLAKKTGIELIISGEHPDNELFEHQRNCGLEAIKLAKGSSNIHFEWLPKDHPQHNKAKLKLYQEAKALIYFVQFNEPFGLAMTELLSSATPVIGTNYGSVPEVIQHGITGFVCENTIESFAKAVKNIDNIDPKVCREEAVRRFDRRVMAKNYLKEYQDIIDGKNWG